VFLFGRADLLGGGLANGLGQSLAGQTVFGRHHAVNETLSGHVWTVKKLVDVHREAGVVTGIGRFPVVAELHQNNRDLLDRS